MSELWISWYCYHCGAALEPIEDALRHQLRKHYGCPCCRHVTRELLDEVITERGVRKAPK